MAMAITQATLQLILHLLFFSNKCTDKQLVQLSFSPFPAPQDTILSVT